MSLCRLLSAPLLIGALAAPAFAAPPLGADQNPPKYVDEPELFLSLYNPGGGDGGYVFRIHAHVYGVTGDADAVRLDWMQKGKLLASQRCRMESAPFRRTLPSSAPREDSVERNPAADDLSPAAACRDRTAVRWTAVPVLLSYA